MRRWQTIALCSSLLPSQHAFNVSQQTARRPLVSVRDRGIVERFAQDHS
jgi:hypothetical protein